MDIKNGDKFKFNSDNGHVYDIEIININDYREPDMKYGCDIYDEKGTYAGDVIFIGDDFFKNNKEKLKKIN